MSADITRDDIFNITVKIREKSKLRCSIVAVDE